VEERLQEIESVGLLEKIHTPESTAGERLASRARADAHYAAAFRDLGIDPDALDPEEAARRIEARPALKRYLVSALDDWLGPRRQARPDDPAATRWLLDVARRVDPDPWRDRWRDMAGQGDGAALAEVAPAVDVQTQRPSALLALAEQLLNGGRLKAAMDLSRRAQRKHPEDFWLPFYQAHWQGQDSDPLVMEEILRCYAVAVALRPRNVEVWAGYGGALDKVGRIEEAANARQRVIELDPVGSSGQTALQWALYRKRDREGLEQARRRTEELLRERLRRDPEDD
jgi:tetratricopeptide (TPR) repeat protein